MVRERFPLHRFQNKISEMTMMNDGGWPKVYYGRNKIVKRNAKFSIKYGYKNEWNLSAVTSAPRHIFRIEFKV